MADKNTIALAVKMVGRAAASREVKELRKDLGGVGPDAQRSGTQTSRSLEKVQTQVKRTGETADRSFSRFRRSNTRAAETAEKSAPRFRRAASPMGTLARRAAAVGAAFVSIKAANDAVDAVEELGSAAMGLAGNFGMAEEQAGRWAALAKVRGLAPKALNQSFGTLAKNVEKVAPAADSQRDALAKLAVTQEQQLADAENIENAQKREAARQKILSATQKKRADLTAKGLGTQAEALRAFGISSSEARDANKDMYGFLLKVADGYEKLGPGPKRSALAMSLFGRGWQTLRPLLSKGSKGLEEQLGLVDELGANIAGTTDNTSDLIAAQRKQKLAMLGIQVQMGTALQPLYIKSAELTMKLAKSANKAWPTIRKEVKPVVDEVEQVVEDVAAFVEEHPQLLKVAAGFVAVATAAKGVQLAGKVTGINAVVRALWKVRGAAKSAAAARDAALAASADALGPDAPNAAASGKARRYGRRWGRTAGVAAGEAAAANTAAGIGADGAITGRSMSRMSAIGRALGGAIGGAMALYALNEFAHETANAGVQDILEKLRGGMGDDKRPGKSIPGTQGPFSQGSVTEDQARRRGLNPKKMPGIAPGTTGGFSWEAQARQGAAAAMRRDAEEKRRERRRRRDRRRGPHRGRASGGIVSEQATLVGEQGPEIAEYPAGTRIYPRSHPATRAAVADSRPTAVAAPSTHVRPTIVVPVYLGSRLLYQAVSVESERETLSR